VGAGDRVVAANTEGMRWQHRKLSADEAARDFCVTAQAFADTFVQYVCAEHDGEGTALIERRRGECCALIWAVLAATFDASALTRDERAKVVPLVRESLLPSWRKYRVDGDDFIARVRERSGAYLRHQDPGSQLKTATGFMNELVSSLDAEAVRLLPVRTLTAMLAHRMLSDLRRLNELKANCSIL
jgi:hypothetical protein